MNNKIEVSGGWEIIDHDKFVEIMPLNDLNPHESGTNCVCHPEVDEEGLRPLITHDAFDNRDYFEENPNVKRIHLGL